VKKSVQAKEGINRKSQSLKITDQKKVSEEKKNGVRGEGKRNTVQRRRNDTLCSMRSRCLLLTLSPGLLQFLNTHQSSSISLFVSVIIA